MLTLDQVGGGAVGQGVLGQILHHPFQVSVVAIVVQDVARRGLGSDRQTSGGGHLKLAGGG